MSKIIPFLVSGFKQTPPTPSNDEPYRIGWSGINQIADEASFDTPSRDPNHSRGVLCQYFLTDYADPVPVPAINISNASAFSANRYNIPSITLGTPTLPDNPSLATITDIVPIANPDRRGKLPKVFWLRFLAEGTFRPVHIMRYNLNASGSKYIALEITRNFEGSILGCIRMVVDGVTVQQSANVTSSLMTNNMSQELRLIVFGDRVEFHVGEPGDKFGELPLLVPAVAEAGAYFELFRAPAGYTVDPDFVDLALDTFIIYDGYY